MARTGAPEGNVPTASGLKVGLVAALWHQPIVDDLLRGARLALSESGVRDVEERRVSGAFELPVVVADLAKTGYDATVALGVVVRGETPHFDYICQAVSMGLTTVAVSYGVPVGFGVLTCETVEQAQARARWPAREDNKGYEAAMAAISTRLLIDHSVEHEPVEPTEASDSYPSPEVWATASSSDSWESPSRLEIRGDVIRGDGRGRQLGFPTANISVEATCTIPPDGVYAGWLNLDAEWLPAAVSVGANVTFDQVETRVEAHVLDRADLALIGRRVSIRFIERLRDMQKFRDVAELVVQMHRDLDVARQILARCGPFQEKHDD